MLLVVLLMAAGLWVAAYAGASGKVPRGTAVAGVDIGGRDKYEASAVLASDSQRALEEPITVTLGTVTTEIAPADAGLSVDAVATVAKVVGPRSWDPRRLWRYYAGGAETQPVLNVDSRRMDALLDTLDEQAGQPAHNAGISLSGGRVVLTEPRDGAQLDRDRAAAVLVDAYLHGRENVRLPLRLVPPDVDGADLETAVTTIANPAVSGPVTLTFADKQVVLAPRDYADLLSLVTEDGALALDVDSAGLAALVDPAAQEAVAVDASVAVTGGVPTIVPAVAGETFDEAGVTEAFLQGVTAQGAARTVAVTGTKSKATFTSADARALGVTAPVASYAVPVPASAGSTMTAAVAQLNGALLRPGDTFSFKARVPSVSGSVSRLATAAWNAGFLAGLTDVTRSAPTTASAGLPAGRDALVDAGHDLQLRNDTAYGVLLSAYVANGSVVVDAWSTKQWDVVASTGAPYAVTARTSVPDADPGCVGVPGADGYSIDLTRTFTNVQDPAQTRTDTVTTTYLPEQAVVCQAPVVPVP